MATKIERIYDLLGKVEEDIKKSVIKDVVQTLKDFADDKNCAEGERAGILAAIEIIEENY